MTKVKNKAIAMAIISMLSAGVVGCENNNKLDNVYYSVEESSEEVPSFPLENNEQLEVSIDQSEKESIEEKYKYENIFEKENIKVEFYDMVTATTNVNIRESAIDGTILSVLKKGSSLVMVEKLDNGWYAVEYNGSVAYVCGDYLKETIGFEIVSETIGIHYTDKETNLIIPDYLNNGEETSVKLSETTRVNVYDENGEYYLCSVGYNVGYILKTDVMKLSGNYVVVDISDQTLTLYEDDKIILETPVVTGKPKTPTDLGLFQIYSITHNRYLVGPGYRSYVDIMMKYNGGEGLHDAEFHTDENGRKHGWRKIEEFGGTTYLTNGSHGCVNMPHDAAIEAGKVLKLGDYVLVQE